MTKLNIKKTKAMWLGKWANNKDKPLHLKWVSGPTRILGIYFSHDEKGNNEMNFDLKINKLQAKLDVWRSRDLTLFGKTMIIKTLGGIIFNIFSFKYQCTKRYCRQRQEKAVFFSVEK